MKNCNMQSSNMVDCTMREPRMENRMEVCMDSCMDVHMQKRMPNEMCFMRENNIYNRCDAYPIGMAYVPWQTFKDIYDPERGLAAGTIFAELDKPFMGRRAFRR